MTAIAIFVKTPGLTPLKTRLATSIGNAQAIELYLQCAAAVAEAAQQAGTGAVYWASAETLEQTNGHWKDLPRLAQGDGNLGARMHRILSQLVRRHGSGLLLGADAPQLEPDVLRHAAGWLRREAASNILGPARDGGFWTFGANHVPPLERWTRVTYSRPDTASAFRQSMGDAAKWLELPPLTDLDTEADIVRVVGELRNLRNPLPSQLALLETLSQA